MTDEQYNEWFRKATKKQKVFVNVYLKTLDPNQAFQCSGYNFKYKNFGKWKIFNKLLPVIQYKLKNCNLNIDKNFIIGNWLNLLYTTGDNSIKVTALKELSKLFQFTDDNISKIQIENKNPIVIQFDQKNK